MTSSVIMKKNMNLALTSYKDREIEDYRADKNYAKRLGKYFSLINQYSYSEKLRRPSYYAFSVKYNKDKENIYDLFQSDLVDDNAIKEFGVFQSDLVDDNAIEEFGVFQSDLVDDNAIEEKYVLSEINRIIDKINKKIDNMNNGIVDLKNKIKELK
jgi:hypothetical protein